MKRQNSNPEEAANLRQKAEKKLKFRRDVAHNVSTEPDLLKLIHELEVHQIELEMQNEELVIAKEKAELAEEKYTELYDFAPSGYVTLSKKGEILELNFAAANMLGKERTKLIKKRFDFLVSKCTQVTFNQFLQDIFIGKIKQSCEAIIEPEGKLPIYVNIEGVISKNDEFCLLTLRDVTEKNRAKKELQSSEEKYRISEFDLKKAQQIAHLGNWALNIETNELLWSDEIYRIFGCEPQAFESTYEAFLGFIHPDDRERVNSAYLKSLDTKTEYQIEHRIITKNNQLKYVREKCTTTFNEQGKPLNSFGIVIDITERKQVEKALEKRLVALTQPLDNSEEIDFEELFNITDIQLIQDELARATNVASIITKPDGTPITAPSNFSRLCNEIIRKTEIGCANCFKSDAALGRPNSKGPTVQLCLSGGLWDAGAAIYVGNRHIANWMMGQVRDEEQSEEKIRAYAAQIGADEDDAAAAFHELPTMSRKQFEQVAKTLFILANQFSDYAYQNVQQARFITDRKRAEQELINAKQKAEESEANLRHLSENLKQERILLRTIIDSIPDSIYAKDIECRKILSNEANFQNNGFDKEEDIIGKTDFDMYPVNIADKFFEDDQKVVKQGISLIKREECFNKANGDIKWSLTSKLPLYNDAGKIVGLVGIGRDITERKKAEGALLAKVDELERFFKITVGRETTMIALKKEVNNLLNKLGQDNKYTIHE